MDNERITSPEQANVYMLPEYSSFVGAEGEANPEEIERYREAIRTLGDQNKLRDYRYSTVGSSFTEGRVWIPPKKEEKRGIGLDPDKLSIAAAAAEDFPYLKETMLVPYAHLKPDSREVESFSLFLFTKGDIKRMQEISKGVEQ